MHNICFLHIRGYFPVWKAAVLKNIDFFRYNVKFLQQQIQNALVRHSQESSQFRCLLHTPLPHLCILRQYIRQYQHTCVIHGCEHFIPVDPFCKISFNRCKLVRKRCGISSLIRITQQTTDIILDQNVRIEPDNFLVITQQIETHIPKHSCDTISVIWYILFCQMYPVVVFNAIQRTGDNVLQCTFIIFRELVTVNDDIVPKWLAMLF